MGLLSTGHPLSWKASKPYIREVKRKGIQQFIHLYRSTRNRKDDCLRWGDEVEYTVLHVDKSRHKITLSLRAPEILAELQKQEHSQPEGSSVEVLWRPEYANWMVEGTPGVPYRCFAGDLELVEQNMMLRRLEIFSVLQKNEIVLSITAFPLLGTFDFTTPVGQVLGPASLSLYVPDEAINPHPRFPTLTRNIRHRRGKKVDIRRPVFQDEKTEKEFPVLPQSLVHQNGHSDGTNIHHLLKDGALASNSEVEEEDIIDLGQLAKETTPDIYMDCMAFGMGCCCLQVTLQAKDMDESRYLYDQLAVFAPIMLALTAATPILKGYLLDTDSRWDVISGAVDDRTPEELLNGPKKSRYDSIDLFVSSRKEMIPERYNDVQALLDEESYRTLIENGVDERLAKHVAHLFIRDPLVIYEESINAQDEHSTEHFENIQSTNWNTVRLKPPSLDSNAGWRTEFRPMEVQFTDFENAAFAVFTVLVSRVIIAFDLNFYIPISLVDRNMKAAQSRDAVTQEKFYFRRNVFAGNSHVPDCFKCACGQTHKPRFSSSVQECCFLRCSASCSDCELMTIDQIINGKSVDELHSDHNFAFPGLISLIRGYLDAIELPPESSMKIGNYLDFISAKAKGELLTNASWIRKFVLNHEAYLHNSVINESICYDLLKAIHDINTGKRVEYELLGDFYHGKGDCNEISAEMLQEMRSKVEKGPTLLASKDIFRRFYNLTSLSDDALVEMENGASSNTD